MPENRARRLTGTQLKEAELLHAAWKKRYSRNSGAARQLAALHGVTPGAIGQMTGGYRPINFTWKMRFAKFLECAPEDIWPGCGVMGELPPNLPEYIAELLAAAVSAPEPAVRAATALLSVAKPRDELHARLQSLSADRRAAVVALVEALSGERPGS